MNNQSIVLHLACGSSPVLFTGDIESEAESRLARLSEPLKAAVLKVPHHGAKGSVNEPFLRAVNPQLAVVSVGQANAYGHPSPAMVDTYSRLGIALLRTDRHGAVSIMGTPAGLQVTCQSGREFRRVVLGSGGARRGEESEGQNLKRWLSSQANCDLP